MSYRSSAADTLQRLDTVQLTGKMGPDPKLTVYVDSMSQPCRAIMQLIRYNKLPVEEKLIQIGKRQHLTREYRAINPFGKVPVLQVGRG